MNEPGDTPESGPAAELTRAWQQNRDDWQERVITREVFRRARHQLLTRAVSLPPAGKARLPALMQSMLWNFQIAGLRSEEQE